MKNPNSLRCSRVSGWALLLAAAGFFAQPACAAMRSWTGAGTNSLWGTRENWAPAGIPQDGDDLVFPAGAARWVNTNSLVFRTFNSITFNGAGGGYVLRGNGISLSDGISAQNTGGANTIAIHISLVSADQTFATTTSTGGLDIEGNVNLNGHNLTLSANTGNLHLGGVISDTGNLTKTGAGMLTIYGGSGNTYDGTVTVQGGLVLLWKSAGWAVTGPLIISGAGTVRLMESLQLSSTETVTVHAGSLLDLNGYSSTIDSLVLTGGSVTTGTGQLTLLGGVRTLAASVSASIEGRLDVPQDALLLDVDDGAASVDLALGAVVTGLCPTPPLYLDTATRIVKQGAGCVELSAANDHCGSTVVDEGSLRVAHRLALGRSTGIHGIGGTYVRSNAALVLVGITVTNEILTLSSTHPAGALQAEGPSQWLDSSDYLTLQTNVTIATDSSLVLSANVTGPGGFTKIGPGTLRLRGPLTEAYGGPTRVHEGVLELDHPVSDWWPDVFDPIRGELIVGDGVGGFNADVVRYLNNHQIHTNSLVTVTASGLLDLNGFDDRLGPLVFEGGVVATGLGTARLAHPITVHPARDASIHGHVELAALCAVDFTGITTLNLYAEAHGSGGLELSGPGILHLQASNSYSGWTILNNAHATVSEPTGLGTTAAGTVLNGGSLNLLQARVGNEGLTVNQPSRLSLCGAAACIEVELLALCGNQVSSSAYHGLFQEANPCAGYLADGGGAGSRSYAFDVAPDSLFTVVVSDALTNASCGDYVLRVRGGDCRPVLHIAPAGANQAVLHWTSSALGYQLEGTPSLAPLDFQPVLPLPVVIDGKNTVTNPVPGPARFYRLHKP